MLLTGSTLLFSNLAGWHVSPANSMSIRTLPFYCTCSQQWWSLLFAWLGWLHNPLQVSACLGIACIAYCRWFSWNCPLQVAWQRPWLAIWVLRKHWLLCSSRCGGHAWKLMRMLMWLAALPVSLSRTALPTLQAFFSHWNHPPHGSVTTLWTLSLGYYLQQGSLVSWLLLTVPPNMWFSPLSMIVS